MSQLKSKIVRHNLKVLPNGLLTCEIKVTNPINKISICCDALIDTGAGISLLCSTIFEKLLLEQVDIETVRSIHADEETIITEINLNIPAKEWSASREFFAVRNISNMKNYSAIIGVDILSRFQLVYNGKQNIAWLDE